MSRFFKVLLTLGQSLFWVVGSLEFSQERLELGSLLGVQRSVHVLQEREVPQARQTGAVKFEPLLELFPSLRLGLVGEVDPVAICNFLTPPQISLGYEGDLVPFEIDSECGRIATVVEVSG